MRRRTFFTVIVVLIALTCACGGASGGGAPHGASPNGSSGGNSIIATTPDGSLAELSLSNGARRTLLAPPEPGGFLLYPSVSRDGSRIAYVAQAPPGGTGSIADSGFDLWVAARDGSGPKLIYRHDAPNQQVTYPQWLDDQHLVAIVQERGPDGVVPTLDRFDLGGGERTQILGDVLAFGVSADGAQLVLTQLSDAGSLTLNITDAAGAHARTLLSPADRLSPFSWPRFSPDGTQVAFTAAEAVSVRATTRFVAFGPPPAPARDGPPQDIWTVASGGGTPQRVADLKEDNPAIAWSGDGKHLYANGIKGLYDIDLTNGAVDRIADGVFHGHIAWAP
jgi:Tol biopolymer transport system component